MQRRVLVPALSLILTIMTATLIVPAVAGATPSIADKKAEAKQIMAQISALDTRMEFAVEAYNAATQKLQTVQGKISRNEQQLRIARYNLLVARQILTQHIVSLYKQNKTTMIDVLLSTKSFDQLVNELTAMRQVNQSDAATVASIKSLKQEISRRHAQLVVDRKQAETLVAQRAEKRQQIGADLSQRKEMLQGVQAEIKKLQQEAAARARAAALAAQRAADAAAAAQAQANRAAVVTGGGGVTSSAGSHGGVVGIAQHYLGVPYVWGGASPSGFDCSGLVMYCYAQVGVSLPHNAAMQYASITHVAHGSEQPGDLVFFGYSAGGIHHVGIYVGGGSMIDAPYTGAVVRYDSAFGGDYFASGRP
jgi:cell wall-associated NlpC family hydrolase